MTSLHPHDPYTDAGLLAGSVVDPAAAQAAASRRVARRRRQRLLAIVGACMVFFVAAAIAAQAGLNGAPSGRSAPKLAVTGTSAGVLVVRPGSEPQRVAQVQPVAGGAHVPTATAGSFDLPTVATVERMRSTAELSIPQRRASSEVRIDHVLLAGGRVELRDVQLTAASSIVDATAAGALTMSEDSQLLIDGTPRTLTPNQRIVVPELGTIIVNEQAVVAAAPSGDTQTGPRYRVVGAVAHLRVTTATQALPAGSEIIIGRVDAGVRQGRITAADSGSDAASDPAARPPAPQELQAGEPAPGTTELPRRPAAVRAATASQVASSPMGAYLFPVLGRHSYVDTWGAPRASTGVPHQGTDIFADEGTPLVAVADGVLDRVGWNTIGGYRFWLFDDQGNSFYYAHLSAYSPLARDGARVQRGDVIGFMGHTGDARYTPTHLHFEVHPGNGAAVNPFAYLNAWRDGVAVAIGLGANGVATATAPLALLGFSDIAANSGLQGSVLDSVPDTRARPVEQENAPQPSDDTLATAITGPGISAAD